MDIVDVEPGIQGEQSFPANRSYLLWTPHPDQATEPPAEKVCGQRTATQPARNMQDSTWPNDTKQ